ncbi:MAG: dihydroneopterin aldolase [Alphaproteobacteria bacterium]|nr:dihydroneopterin aldolase [Alphaproteobacteria bacterium]
MDWIVLQDLRFDAIVGVLPSEQAAAQPLELEVKLGVDLDEAGGTGDLSKSVDYASIAHQVRFLAQQGRWRLIESLGTAICRLLLAPPGEQEGRAPITRVELRIRKPTILGGLAVPGITLRRTREWCKLVKSKAPSRTTIERLEATPLSAAYRVHIEAGTAWQPPPGVALFVIAGRPRHDGQTLAPGAEVARAAGAFENHQKHDVTLLAVGSPLPA